MTTNLEQLGASDRFYYNAVLTNPSDASISNPQPARFLDTRAVPLIKDCSEYYLTIARLSILGATSKLPLLLPDLNPDAPLASNTCIDTAYAVGVRWTAMQEIGGVTIPVAYSNLASYRLQMPSDNITASPSTKTSKFYWVNYASQLTGALNTAISKALYYPSFQFRSLGGATNPFGTTAGNIISATRSIAGDITVPSVDANGSPQTRQTELDYVVADVDPATLKLRLKCITTATNLSEPKSVQQVIYNPFLQYEQYNAGAGSGLPTPTAAVFYQAHLFFGSKLLELFPMPTVPAAATLLSQTAQGYYGPIASISSARPGCSTTGAWLDPDQQVQTLNYNNTVSPSFYRMSCVLINGKAPSGSPLTENRMDRNSASPPLTSPVFPFTYSIGCLVYTQEFAVTNAWTPVSGLCLTSAYIPAYEEAYGVNTYPNPTNSVGVVSNNIVFDLDVEQQQGHDLQEGIVYVPSTYRWAKLKAGASLRNLDFGILLRYRDGTLEPWLLDAPGTISVKFLFTKHPY